MLPRKYLTLTEYDQESIDFTKKALDELRNYCKRDDIDIWKIVNGDFK